MILMEMTTNYIKLLDTFLLLHLGNLEVFQAYLQLI